MRSLFNGLFLVLISLSLNAQETPEFKNFIDPVKHPVRLAGTFGELRSNHFHMGIDIKSSNGKSGDPIVAVADGYVSRVRVSRTGYGNALYIDHPNGYTSVYAHLQKFNDEISAYVTQRQHEMHSFELDIQLDSTVLAVKQGQEIARMGNTGSSSGPHLHFELRKTETEVPANPLVFGIKPKDSTRPRIGSIKVFHLNDELREIASTIKYVNNAANGYIIPGDTLSIGAWRIGIGIQAFDPMNNGYNKNGLYGIKMFVDGSNAFEVNFDSISYDEWNYINAFIDYSYFKKHRRRYQRLYSLPGNGLRFLKDSPNSIIKLYGSKAREIIIKTYDFEGNESELKFWVKRDDRIKEAEPLLYNYSLPFDKESIIQIHNLRIRFPEHTFYESAKIHVNRSLEASTGYYSDVYHIGTSSIPLHYGAELSILVDSTLSDYEREKICLVNCEKPDRMVNFGGYWEGSTFKVRIPSLGSYALYLDDVPPTINFLTPSKNLGSRSSISFRIKDNLRTSGNAKGLSYEAYLDDKWILFEYDLKRNLIRHTFENPPDGNSHTLKIRVEDDRGNSTKKEIIFIR